MGHVEDDEVEASRAPLIDHLIELRSRLIIIIACLTVGFITCFIFSSQLYQLLLIPYRDAAAAVRGVPVEELNLTANFFAPLEFFFVRLKLSLVGAIIVIFPVIAWQVYGFVAPGSTRTNAAHSRLSWRCRRCCSASVWPSSIISSCPW